jgi:hypothetical protein
MLPRATALDARPLGFLWRAPLGWFVAIHCALAGALQLGALIADLARAGRPVPSLPTLIWAWLGLALIATVPALVTVLLTRRLSRVIAIGMAFYLLPVLLLVRAVHPLLTFVPVALLFHTVLALAPAPRR